MKICSRSVGRVFVASVNCRKEELQSAEKPGQHGAFAGPIASIAGKKGIAFGRANSERYSSKWAESMSDLEELVASFHREFEESLGQESYLLADGRVGRISLYEHLVLTSGIAAAFAEELLRQGGKSA
jgi:hypothetical protein